MERLEKIKGNVTLSQIELTHLRNALAWKLSEHNRFFTVIFSSSVISDYTEITDQIETELKERFKEVMGLKKAFWNPRKAWFLLYQSRKQNKAKVVIRRQTVAIFSLYLFGEIKYTFEEQRDFPFENGRSTRGHLNPLQNTLDEGFLIHKQIESVPSLFKNAQFHVKILDTYLENWMEYKKPIKEVCERGGSIQILLCHPNSYALNRRSQDLNRKQNITEKLLRQLEELHEFLSSSDILNSVKVRLFRNLPGLHLVLSDDQYYAGFFLNNNRGAFEGTYIETNSQTSFGKDLEEHFKQIWEQAISYEPQKLKFLVPSQSIEGIKKYIGTWYLYCNRGKQERKRGHSHKDLKQGETPVVRSILQISDEIYDNKLRCTLTVPHLQQSDFEGYAYISKHDSFFKVNFTAKDGEKNEISLVLHKGTGVEKKLMGTFTSLNVQQPIFSIGMAIASKIPTSQKASAEILDTKEGEVNEEEELIIRYLHDSINRLDSIPISNYTDLKLHPFYSKSSPFQGVYKIYSYYKKRGEKLRYINVAILSISPFYKVKYKRIHSGTSMDLLELEGKIQNRPSTILQMAITLQARKDAWKDRFDCLLLRGYGDRTVQNTLMGGAFSSFDTRRQFLVHSYRVIAECISKDHMDYDSCDPEMINPYTEAFSSETHKNIKTLLTGRTNNYIGFVRRANTGITDANDLKAQAKEELDFGRIFFESACQQLLYADLDIEYLMNQLKRAFLHGFPVSTEFRESLNALQEKGIITSELSNTILNHPKFLSLLNLEP